MFRFRYSFSLTNIRSNRWDNLDLDQMYSLNFKDWVEKRRSREEPSYINNKMMHSENGNIATIGEIINISFTNVPGNLSDQNVEIAIKLVLEDQKPGLLGIAEPTYERLSRMYFPGYKLLKGKLKGGKNFRLNVLVKDTVINYSVESLTTEIPCLLVKLGGFKYLFFYREWNKDSKAGTDKLEQQEERWTKFLSRVRDIRGKLVAMGDANLCYLNGETPHQRRLNKMKDDLHEFLSSKGYAQVVKEDTRRKGAEHGCLDHIYTGQLKHISRVINKNIHGWDHNTVGVELRTDGPVFKRKVIVVRKYEKAEPDDFQQAWVQSNPDEIFESKDVDRQIEVLEFKIKHVLDIVAPEKRFLSSENYAPWVNKEIKQEMKERDALRHSAIIGTNTWAEHDVKKNKVKQLLKKAESEWKEKYLDFADEKTGWHRLKMVSGLTQSGDKKIALMIDGELVDDPERVAEFMNNYFIEKIDKIVAECPPNPVESVKHGMDYFKDKQIGHFKLKKVNYKFVKSVTMKMNNVDSTGMDGIPVIVYKRFRSTLTPAITRIINNCIEQGIYPQRFRDGVIVPVPKKNDLTQVANWRPVVLLPVMSRILEGVLMAQMMGYLEGMGLIPDTQHAYRRGHSCVSAWEDIDIIVRKARDEGKACGMLCTDLTGAFNCLSKETLLPNLRMAGFDLHSLGLLDSYLSNRHNSCKVETYTSRPRAVHTGCGEGSSSGPCLWLMHIMSSPEVVRKMEAILDNFEDDQHPAHIPIIRKGTYDAKEANFADDCNTVIVAKDNKTVLQIMEVLQGQYYKFFTDLGLKESRPKQQHIIWSKEKKPGEEFELNGRKAESEIKLLGIRCSSDYTFESQATSVIGRMVARLPHLRKIRDHVSKEVLIRVSTALCMSYAEYGITIWGQKLSIQKRVQKAQNMMLRILTNSERNAGIAPMLSETQLLNIHLTYQYYCVMGTERLIRSKGSMESYNTINWNFPRVRFTRVRHLLLSWRPRTSCGWNAVIQNYARYYNSLGLFNTNWWNEESEPSKSVKIWLKNKNHNGNL